VFVKIGKIILLFALMVLCLVALACSTKSKIEPFDSDVFQISEHEGVFTLPVGGWGYTLIPMERGNRMDGSVLISGQGVSMKIEDSNGTEVKDLGIIKQLDSINIIASANGNYRLNYKDITPDSDEKTIEFNIIVWNE